LLYYRTSVERDPAEMGEQETTFGVEDLNTDRNQAAAGDRVRRVAVLGLSALLVGYALIAALASPAPAARGLTIGFSDDDYQSSDPAVRAQWLDRTAASGAGIVRLNIGWGTVAPQRPTDPKNPASTSYDFSGIDPAVRDAKARGLAVLLSVNVAPAWAEGPGRAASAQPGTWMPNPSDFADFLQAIAARYTGNFDPDGSGPAPPLPAVDSVQAWNEPNYEYWLSPQYQGRTAVGVEHYRKMLNASYNAVKAVNPQMLVVTGGTAPYGDPPGGPYSSIGPRVRPVDFWQQLLCVRSVKGKKKKKKKKNASASAVKFVRTPGCPGRPMFDVFAHHPISNTGNGPQESGPHRNDASTPDLGRVVRVLRAAERVGTVSGGRHPVWVTELWWDSNPPNPAGAPLAVQARWSEESLYLFWKAGASVAINFQFRDSPERPTVLAGFQAGVFLPDGRPKPAYTAFTFPFVAERLDKRRLRAWGKAPEAGQLSIQRKQGGRWVAIRKIQVRKGAVFVAKLRLRGAQRLRATVGGNRSLVWKQSGSAARTSASDPPTAKILAAAPVMLLILVGTALRLRKRRLIRERRRRTRSAPS
jgi:hypothetical protein